MTVDVEIKGLLETQQKQEQVIRDLHGSAMLDGMRDAALIVERGAKINAPVDTGRLRASITPEVRMEGTTVVGVVGSNVVYAPFVELGTRPHWPPVSALEPWASRHGMDAFVVARAIALKGTKAHRYLQRAFEENQPQIVDRLGQAVNGIVEK